MKQKWQISGIRSPGSNSNKEKRIVKPHIRCGHFQGYWIGKGRTEYVTKYIKPIFVLGGSKNATIHNVK